MRKSKKEELEYYINELKTIKKEIINISPTFLKSTVYKVTLNNGKTIIREKLTKNNNNGSAAIILPITKENNVVLTIEPRVFTKKTIGLGLPAGYIEQNELPYLAALRELKEETGYTTNNIINLGGFYQDMGCSQAYNQSFVALDCEKTSNQQLDESEFIKYFECTIDEMYELINNGYIQGANSLLTISKAKKYLKERR